ncbi:Nitroreductase [Bifidobacterium subtile]|uniref:Nitroreductase n=2 Tax=Bifidobacterium subtile TaxID=77635 RepID=A0A087EB74_9BIFI|nr:Nitroreductase [Bifidobacterium subtile]QOL37147.1 nitroreductase [Bifidobacterium subtile]
MRDNLSMSHTQLIDAVAVRTAIRRYDPVPIDEDTARQLDMTLDAVNTLSGLHLQLICNEYRAFSSAVASGRFANVMNYLAIVGPRGDNEGREKAGFYGERVVLTAVQRSLGTCWVAASIDREQVERHCSINRGEELYLVAAIGHPEHHEDYAQRSYEDLAQEQRAHRSSRSFEEFTPAMSAEDRASALKWFTAGVEAAMKSPSARNLQPIRFRYDADDDTATAHIDYSVQDNHAFNDLGIAKLHFQIGAGSGSWTWGDGGRFSRRQA